jgi:hypothetical protein
VLRAPRLPEPAEPIVHQELCPLRAAGEITEAQGIKQIAWLGTVTENSCGAARRGHVSRGFPQTALPHADRGEPGAHVPYFSASGQNVAFSLSYGSLNL